MNLAVLFSGGKDSTMALYWCLQNGYDVKYLVSAIPANPDSMLFHTANIRLTRKIADAIGIPLIQVEVKSTTDLGESEELKKALKKLDIEAIAAGGVSSRYQAKIFGKIAQDLGLKLIAPYWNKPHDKLIQDAIDAGFEIIFTSISADGFDQSWLGRRLNQENFEKLKELQKEYRFDIGGEGGEYCTTVIDGPIFKKRIEILEDEKFWKGFSGKYVIRKVQMVEKSGDK